MVQRLRYVRSVPALHMSEAEAYLRIRAARASRKHPVILVMLGDGRLHLTGIAKLSPYHHRDPFGRGGGHSLENLKLMCRAHNSYLAEMDYGKEVMGRYRSSSVREGGPVLLGGADFVPKAGLPAARLRQRIRIELRRAFLATSSRDG